MFTQLTKCTLTISIVIEVHAGIFEHAIPLWPRSPATSQLQEVAKAVRSRDTVGWQTEIPCAHLQPGITLLRCVTHHGNPTIGSLFSVSSQAEWRSFWTIDSEGKGFPQLTWTMLHSVIGQENSTHRLRVLQATDDEHKVIKVSLRDHGILNQEIVWLIWQIVFIGWKEHLFTL